MNFMTKLLQTNFTGTFPTSNSRTITTSFGITSRVFFSSNSALNPAATYDDLELHKDRILKENKGKSGVYRLTNLVRGWEIR
jgi:hypothetical protein